ncbi:MAG TPA: lanthionine synthetase LanC family protein [Blastocatellia bacterium]|nr:lanthionine synthetase LanC family protein [Blastocatellia bacterium]
MVLSKAPSIAMLVVLAIGLPIKAGDGANLDAALEAARWIKASAIRNDAGTTWPSVPGDPLSANNNLYAGGAGVVLFLLETYRATDDRTHLQEASAGANHLVLSLSTEKSSGLYDGISGIGFALQETFKATRDERYHHAANRCAQLVRDRAVKAGKGVEWNDSTDIISGSAGIGLFLLYAAKEFKEAGFGELAGQAADRLIELGRPDGVGMKWAMTPGYNRLMPNFSHGTAGVAYFLATLYQSTKKIRFLNAAMTGAKYLQSIAKTGEDGCLIFHNEPDGKDLYYLGWCHGPTGTARLFYRLYTVTGKREWMDWVRKSANSILQSGVPEKQTPGFWSNVSQCCGSAGVAEFFLSLYQTTHDRRYLDFSKRVTANLLSKATRDQRGMRWIQAEHRVKPDLLVAQTGYMQGAAGIGMLLIHLYQVERGKKGSIILPDSPY